MIAWSLDLCESLSAVDRILAVVPEEYISEAETIAAARGIRKIVKCVPGGETRQESAYRALTALPFADDDIVVFHDVARPFLRPDVLLQCIDEAERHGAAAVYVPVHDTIAEIRDGYVRTIPPRETLFCAQTPQAFQFSIISRAHNASRQNSLSGTDDVSLAWEAGFSVKMIEGDHSNFKITTDLDYQIARSIADELTTE